MSSFVFKRLRLAYSLFKGASLDLLSGSADSKFLSGGLLIHIWKLNALQQAPDRATMQLHFKMHEKATALSTAEAECDAVSLAGSYLLYLSQLF
jgi:hypothetical protein